EDHQARARGGAPQAVPRLQPDVQRHRAVDPPARRGVPEVARTRRGGLQPRAAAARPRAARTARPRPVQTGRGGERRRHPQPRAERQDGAARPDWPDPDNMKDLPSALSSVRAAVAGHLDWEVTEEVVLATFRSHKEAMYRDLLDHEDQILAHPLVRAIGLGDAAGLPEDALYFEPLDADRIDELQPPELTPLVLDADSSQRQCV